MASPTSEALSYFGTVGGAAGVRIPGPPRTVDGPHQNTQTCAKCSTGERPTVGGTGRVERSWAAPVMDIAEQGLATAQRGHCAAAATVVAAAAGAHRPLGKGAAVLCRGNEDPRIRFQRGQWGLSC